MQNIIMVSLEIFLRHKTIGERSTRKIHKQEQTSAIWTNA